MPKNIKDDRQADYMAVKENKPIDRQEFPQELLAKRI